MNVDIERLLKDLGLTPGELARRLGASEAAVSRWRSGTHSPSGLYARKVEELARVAALRRSGGTSAQSLAEALARAIDLATPRPDERDDDYRRGYQQGQRDLLAALLAALTQTTAGAELGSYHEETHNERHRAAP